MAFLALPMIAVAGFGLYRLLTYKPPVPPPPPKIDHFRVSQTSQKEAGGEWTVRVEWDTENGETVTLEPDPGKVEAQGKHTYLVADRKIVTLRVKNASGESAHELTLEAVK